MANHRLVFRVFTGLLQFSCECGQWHKHQEINDNRKMSEIMREAEDEFDRHAAESEETQSPD